MRVLPETAKAALACTLIAALCLAFTMAFETGIGNTERRGAIDAGLSLDKAALTGTFRR